MVALTVLSSALAAAQTRDYNTGEFFIGYSHGQVDGSTFRFVETNRDFRDTGPLKFNGFNIAGVYNIARYIGIKGDFSATFNGGDLNVPINPTTTIQGDGNNSLYNFLGGVQFKDNSSDRRVKPFGHVLVGGAHARTRVNAACSPPAVCGGFFLTPSSEETGLAGAVGGGLDVRLNDRFDFRVGQIDYNPVRLDTGTLHNVRIGIGIVIK